MVGHDPFSIRMATHARMLRAPGSRTCFRAGPLRVRLPQSAGTPGSVDFAKRRSLERDYSWSLVLPYAPRNDTEYRAAIGGRNVVRIPLRSPAPQLSFRRNPWGTGFCDMAKAWKNSVTRRPWDGSSGLGPATRAQHAPRRYQEGSASHLCNRVCPSRSDRCVVRWRD